MKSLFKIFHPDVFQGSPRSKNYFEGWYFKHVAASGNKSFAVIPGISLSDDPHSFIQFIDGSGRETKYFRYEVDEFEYSTREFEIRVGKSVFGSKGISLNITDGTTSIFGELEYSESLRLRKSIMMPGIMGWYSYVPTMECNHGVVSITHNLSGFLRVDNAETDFSGGKGYIEKDWGVSFPESWIWMQCNNFREESSSVMLSVARVPWRRSYFIGFIAFLSKEGKTTVFASYNGARIVSLKRTDESSTCILISKGKIRLNIIVEKSTSSLLKAPLSGEMTRSIKESLNSKVIIECDYGSGQLYRDTGSNAGYEETEGIFKYF